jgi:predicted restriction endonuclease
MTRALGVPLRSVTPQLRRLVFARDGGRCIVPGCRHWRFIDVHHVVPRAHRGPNRLENLACLCTAHHRAVHEGVLAIEGSATAGWVVRHAGAGVYGRAWG